MTYIVRIHNTPYQFSATEGEPILSAALRQNIDLPWGCGSGVCGTCMGKVLKGEILYPNGAPLALFEDDAAQGLALFCVSCAQSDLILHIPELG